MIIYLCLCSRQQQNKSHKSTHTMFGNPVSSTASVQSPGDTGFLLAELRSFLLFLSCMTHTQACSKCNELAPDHAVCLAGLLWAWPVPFFLDIASEFHYLSPQPYACWPRNVDRTPVHCFTSSVFEMWNVDSAYFERKETACVCACVKFGFLSFDFWWRLWEIMHIVYMKGIICVSLHHGHF